MDNWLYFGCNQRAGHYLFERGMRPARTKYSRNLERFDGMLAPQDSTTPYVATVSRLAGWGMTALSFWDYSVDKRGGCNSIVFAPTLDIDPSEMLAKAAEAFPEVFNRLPQAVTLKET